MTQLLIQSLSINAVCRKASANNGSEFFLDQRIEAMRRKELLLVEKEVN